MKKTTKITNKNLNNKVKSTRSQPIAGFFVPITFMRIYK
jgi:hypothetical protein